MSWRLLDGTQMGSLAAVHYPRLLPQIPLDDTHNSSHRLRTSDLKVLACSYCLLSEQRVLPCWCRPAMYAVWCDDRSELLKDIYKSLNVWAEIDKASAKHMRIATSCKRDVEVYFMI